jgi:hypothetical protein
MDLHLMLLQTCLACLAAVAPDGFAGDDDEDDDEADEVLPLHLRGHLIKVGAEIAHSLHVVTSLCFLCGLLLSTLAYTHRPEHC